MFPLKLVLGLLYSLKLEPTTKECFLEIWAPFKFNNLFLMALPCGKTFDLLIIIWLATKFH